MCQRDGLRSSLVMQMLSASEREDLDTFLGQVDRLRRVRLLQTPRPVALEFKFHRRLGAGMRSEEPHDDDVATFVSFLRPLLAQRERISLHRVHNLCWARLLSDARRREVADVRASWKQALKQGHLKLVLDDKTWTPEFVMDTWINGYYAHTDREKRARLAALGPIEVMLTRHTFLGAILKAGAVAAETAVIVRRAASCGDFG